MFTEFLVRRLIRQADRGDDLVVRRKYGELGGIVGMLCNVMLFAAKLTVGLISGSIAIMADAVNNLSDAGSSVVTLVGFRLASKPADKEHPFGHGRFEYVAGLVIAVVIVSVGLNFFKDSIQRIWEPEVLTVSNWGLIALTLAIPVKCWMFFFYRTLGRRIHSTVMEATAFDSLSDILTTSVVLVSVLIGRWTDWPTDGYAGVLVAGFVIFGGIKIIRDTINPLIGEAPDPELVEELERKMLENPDICGVHDLIIHNYGPGRYFASAHAEVNSDCDPMRIHDSLERTENEVATALPVRLTLHCDPFDRNDPEYKKWRLAAVGAAKALDGRFNVFDFRMSQHKRYLHLRFQVLVPLDSSLSSNELRKKLQQKLRELNPHVTVSIIVDNSLV